MTLPSKYPYHRQYPFDRRRQNRLTSSLDNPLSFLANLAPVHDLLAQDVTGRDEVEIVFLDQTRTEGSLARSLIDEREQ